MMNKWITCVTMGCAFAISSWGCAVDATDTRSVEQDFRKHKGKEGFSGKRKCKGKHSFSLSSPNFVDGESLPYEHTCEGQPFGSGYSPELNWTKGPKGTKSYAIVFVDTTILDAGEPNFAYHWAIWNIPKNLRTLREGIAGVESGEVVDFPEGMRGAQQTQARGVGRFFGPCPSWQVTQAEQCGTEPVPRNDDSYAFILYALPEKDIEVPEYDAEENPNYVDTLNSFFEGLKLGEPVVLTATSDAVPTTTPPVPCPE